MPNCRRALAIAAAAVSWTSGHTLAQLSPEESLRTLRVLDGFRVELAVAEPNVLDPIAICWDEKGRMYVCEMRGFQLGPGGKGIKQLGAIRLLDDTDGDGRYETSSIFAEGLTYPTAATPYQGGLLVGTAPDLIYLKDTDGDNVADKREVLYTGFGTENHEQLLNTMQFHFDNWIMGCAGNNGGDIRSARRLDDAPVSLRRRSFRFRPLAGRFEATSGGGQYGLTCDDWGRFFTCTNSNHIIERVLPDRYLRRNEYLPVSGVLKSISDHAAAAKLHRISPMEEWRVIRTKQRAADPDLAKRMSPTELVPGGFVTAASGNIVYRGGLFGPDFVNNTFVCDSANNVVHRDVLVENGVTYVARRAKGEGEKEFLASPDNWHRPCFLAVGPDGALYVVDMYREIIETPVSIPEPIQKLIDMEAGRDRGRIYRIIPDGFRRPARPNLGQAGDDELVAELANPNAWHRHTAQRLLYERQDRAAVAPLRKAAASAESPQARLHALWALDGLRALTDDLILAALEHSEPGLRENAVRLAEGRLKDGPSAPLVAGVLALASDDHARVRFQLAFTLGELSDPRAIDALARIAERDAETSWTRIAVLSSCTNTAEPLLQRLLGKSASFCKKKSKGKTGLLRQLAALIGARQDTERIGAIIQSAAAGGDAGAWWRAACLRGIGEGLRRGKKRAIKLPSAQEALVGLLQSTSPAVRAAAADVARSMELTQTDTLRAAVASAVKTAIDAKQAMPARLAATQLLSFGVFETVAEPIGGLLTPQQPKELQTAAIAALTAMSAPEATRLLIERWRNFTPDLRTKALESIFSRKERLPLLLDGIDEGEIQPWSVDPQRREQLVKHPDAEIKERAAELFQDLDDEDRREILEQFRPALKLEGDTKRGIKVFEERCGDCHQLANVGYVVGPDLKGIKDRPPEQLLEDIILPSHALTPGYEPYVIETAQGEMITGILAAETTTSVTLLRAKGEKDTVLRRNIESMYSTSLSAMPTELEADLKPQDVADLIVFLRTQ